MNAPEEPIVLEPRPMTDEDIERITDAIHGIVENFHVRQDSFGGLWFSPIRGKDE